MDAQQHEKRTRAQLVAAATKFNFAFRRIKIQTIERLTLFAYRWYLLTGPRIGASCVCFSLSVFRTPSLSLFIPLFHSPSYLSRGSLCSSHARPSIYHYLSFPSVRRHPSLLLSPACSRSLIPARIKMKMDRTARQMAKWIYAGRGRNFHFSVANCMPRLSAGGGVGGDPLEFSANIFCI